MAKDHIRKMHWLGAIAATLGATVLAAGADYSASHDINTQIIKYNKKYAYEFHILPEQSPSLPVSLKIKQSSTPNFISAPKRVVRRLGLNGGHAVDSHNV
ncbi:MAG: hypothetical protein ACOH12_15195 [Parvibaculaceae bacterium]